MDTATLIRQFESYFNAKPEHLIRAPGRVNLIGEHTDYNDGFVLPMAIDREVLLALRPRHDGLVRIISLDLDTEASFNLQSLQHEGDWIEYPKGIAFQLLAEGHSLHGFEAVMTGNVPRGAGLSSSAAVELAIARAFSAVSNINWNASQMAKSAQKAENVWVGVNCGIMDQMASAASREGFALFLDCRTLETQHAPLPAGVSVVILDTSTRRGLVDSAYNERRSQCEEAASWFGVSALRDVSVAELKKWNSSSQLSETAFRRARHVISENKRVLEALEAMRNGNIQELGQLFNASHASLRDDFEVTNEALNLMVACAQEQEGCFGARMTGAGFGGCAVALVKDDKTKEFSDAVSKAYKLGSGKEASVYVCKASEGAGFINS